MADSLHYMKVKVLVVLLLSLATDSTRSVGSVSHTMLGKIGGRSRQLQVAFVLQKMAIELGL